MFALINRYFCVFNHKIFDKNSIPSLEMEVDDLKKSLLIISIFLVIVIIGLLMVNRKDDYTSKYHETDDILLYSEDENFQKVENSEADYERRLIDLAYLDDDLVYREYSLGNCLEKGNEILIEKNKIICEVENVQNIVIILNDTVYKEFSFDNNNIELTLEKSGNYAFIAIGSDGNSVDITSIVKVRKSADGGIILLN